MFVTKIIFPGIEIYMWKESNSLLIQACFWIVAIHSPWFYSTKTLVKESSSANCYDSFTHFSPLIFLIYSLHVPTSCLLFLVYILISFYRLSFLSCAALLFMHSLMHSTITHAQCCTVCLLMHNLLRHSLITQYIIVMPRARPVRFLQYFWEPRPEPWVRFGKAAEPWTGP